MSEPTANFTYVATGGVNTGWEVGQDGNRYEGEFGAVCTMACDITPGIITAPLLDLQTLVAGSTTFQTWTGSGSGQIAANRVILQAVREDAIPPRPYALVSFRPGSLQTDIVKGYFTSGTLTLSFEVDVSPCLDANPNQAMLVFGNWVEQVIQDIWTQVGIGTTGLQLIRAINLSAGPEYSSWSEPPYLWVEFQVEFGAK